MKTQLRTANSVNNTRAGWKLRIGTVVALVALTLHAPRSAMGQGALTPPGPPAPTFKTLQQVEPRTPITNLPYTISSPGSYYFVTNLTGASGSHGIIISADNVTLDLGGFEMVGGEGPFLNAIWASPGIRTNIVIRNGTVRGWSSQGLQLANAYYCQITDVRVIKCGGVGVQVGTGARVQGVTAVGNGAPPGGGGGITAGGGCVIVGCIATSNGGYGISSDTGSTIIQCAANFNTNGIGASSHSVIRDCAARNNGGVGIDVGAGNNLSDCAVGFNSSTGIVTGAGCAISQCTVDSNVGAGLQAGTGNQVSRCVFRGNFGIGLTADDGSVIEQCTLRENTGGGILVSDSSLVANNHCSTNGTGTAGIRATGTDNRIDGNNCVGHATGFKVDTGSNLIIRNSARSTTLNYDLAGGNANGEILNVSSGTTITNVSAWANFSY